MQSGGEVYQPTHSIKELPPVGTVLCGCISAVEVTLRNKNIVFILHYYIHQSIENYFWTIRIIQVKLADCLEKYIDLKGTSLLGHYYCILLIFIGYIACRRLLTQV